MEAQIEQLRKQIEATEAQLSSLKARLHQAEQARAANSIQDAHHHAATVSDVLNGSSYGHNGDRLSSTTLTTSRSWPLEQDEYRRYGRQLIMPEIGLPGQLRLKKSKVLIVGVGGLGCPAGAYLAGAGVGTLGLMDGDTVELSNLHRQVAHTTSRIGMSKVDSAYEYLSSLNPLVKFNRHSSHLSPEKAIPIFEQYDIILDCTDHPTSRYLISDACVLTGKSLVSASALKTEGQLIVLNNPPWPPGHTSGGPCYRCIFPKPPPAESVLSCGEGGILGPVVGVMGVLQALEAIKLLSTEPQMPNGDAGGSVMPVEEPAKPSMLMFSAYSNPQFRTVRLRSRRNNCVTCSPSRTIEKQNLTSGSLDYVAFCGTALPINVLPPELRVSARDFAEKSREDESTIVIDTRDKTQFNICALQGSINVPWTGNSDSWLADVEQHGALDDKSEKFIVCRLGNDSQLAARAMMDRLGQSIQVKDVKGGFQSWREQVDAEWPDY